MVHKKATGGWVSDIFSMILDLISQIALSILFGKIYAQTIEDRKFGVKQLKICQYF